MAKKPEPPPKPPTWDVYKIAEKAIWLGNRRGAREASRCREERSGIRSRGMAPVCTGAALTQAGDLDRGRKWLINEFNQKVALPTDNP
jgi:hypothetical protein